jgi:hypothetical protein
MDKENDADKTGTQVVRKARHADRLDFDCSRCSQRAPQHTLQTIVIGGSRHLWRSGNQVRTVPNPTAKRTVARLTSDRRALGVNPRVLLRTFFGSQRFSTATPSSNVTVIISDVVVNNDRNDTLQNPEAYASGSPNPVEIATRFNAACVERRSTITPNTRR